MLLLLRLRLLLLLHLRRHACPFVLVVAAVPKLVGAPGAGGCHTPLWLLGSPGLLLLLLAGGPRSVAHDLLVWEEQLLHFTNHG